jgi:hypothetical protein
MAFTNGANILRRSRMNTGPSNRHEIRVVVERQSYASSSRLAAWDTILGRYIIVGEFVSSSLCRSNGIRAVFLAALLVDLDREMMSTHQWSGVECLSQNNFGPNIMMGLTNGANIITRNGPELNGSIYFPDENGRHIRFVETRQLPLHKRDGSSIAKLLTGWNGIPFHGGNVNDEMKNCRDVRWCGNRYDVRSS